MSRISDAVFLPFKVSVKTSLKIVNFLDVMFNLNTGELKPYIKPHISPLYINFNSNHPPKPFTKY